MKHKHDKERVNRSKIKLISIVSFLFGFSDALLVYVLSSYIKTVFGTDNVSAFYLASFAIISVLLLYLHTIIRKVGKSLLLFLLFLLLILTSTVLILLEPSWITIAALMLHLVVSNLVWVNLDILLESVSSDSQSGRIRGLYLTIVNTGWVLAPLLSTRLLDRFGFASIFFTELVLYALTLIIALVGLSNINHSFKEVITPRSILRKIRTRKDILRIYHISFAAEFFYAVMVVYSPLYLLHLGFDWKEIGIIFTIMLVPFVLIQYPLGVLADKRFGEKEMLIAALVLIGASTLSLTVIESKEVAIWAIAFFITRIGAASADILRDSYFYKRIGADDVDIIAFFRTARPVANIAAAIIVGVSLFFLPLQSVFVIASLIVATSLVPAFLLVDNESEREVNGIEARLEA